MLKGGCELFNCTYLYNHNRILWNVLRYNLSGRNVGTGLGAKEA
jgi:hypothetical protein